MYLSLDWLKDYVKIPNKISPEELGLKLTLHTVEIDDVLKEAEKFKNIVVGVIKEVKPHEQADKLQIAIVDVGAENDLQIVCGAPNIEAGQKVPVALVGAILPNGLEIKEAKIRGVESCGMLCAEDELDLGNDHAGILILEKNAKIGLNFGEYLNLKDVIYEVDNKSITHRPDLWSHIGLAREIGAFLKTDFKEYEPKIDFEKNKIDPEAEVNVEVEVKDHKLCPRYMAVAVSGIKIEASPKWLQKRLSSVGVRPINNVVDITNYVMFELGQPMHAFDANFILKGQKSGKIVVRQAKDGEEIVTLDDEKRELTKDNIVIADKDHPIAIAGVMGGENSEVSDDTTSIIFESANFDFVSIRKTSQKFALRTEASKRFEKCLDPNLCEKALKRALELLKDLCPEMKIISQVADKKDFSLNQDKIEVSKDWLQKFIGIKIDDSLVVKILTSLGFTVEDGEENLMVTVPSWRATKDISIKEDLAEEIARIYGYDEIEAKMPQVEMKTPRKDNLKDFVRKVKNILSFSANLTEVHNYSFVGAEQLTKLGIDYSSHLRLKNPIVRHQSMCRQSLAPNMIDNVKTNQTRFDSLKLYEVGSIYSSFEGNLPKNSFNEEKLPFQELRLGILAAGLNMTDVFNEVKGVITLLFESLDLEVVFNETEAFPTWSDKKTSASIKVKNIEVGAVNVVDLSVAKKVGVKKQVCMAEISLEKMLHLVSEQEEKVYREFEKFPPLLRDLAFVVNKKVKYNDLKNEIIGFDENIKKAELFDEFQGDKLGQDKKSLAFNVTYQADKTLTGKEVDQIQKKLFKHLEKRFDASLRDF